jgi:hypothetical protein
MNYPPVMEQRLKSPYKWRACLAFHSFGLRWHEMRSAGEFAYIVLDFFLLALSILSTISPSGELNGCVRQCLSAIRLDQFLLSNTG